MHRPCRLCGQHKKLCLSHIVPKSFAKRMKAGSPQVVEVTISDTPTTAKSNGDHKEYLLCEDCERHIKVCYEDTGTIYLHRKKGASENKEYIIIPEFNYKSYYLFVISIIWRASISSLDIYRPAQELSKLEPYLRHCIKENTLYLSPQGPKLDDFIKVSIARVVDLLDQIKQETLDRLLFSLNFERGENETEGLHYHMMLDGFLITASILPPGSPLASNWNTPGRLLDRRHLKAPKVCFSVIKPIFEAISAVPTTNNPFAPK